jgi:type II secretory pathway pseudopilin PulG
MEETGTQTSSTAGQAVRNRAAILWAAMGVLSFAAVIVGGLVIFRAAKVSQARQDVKVIALALDGFARENGDYPKGTQGEICRMLRGETVNGQNPKKLDYLNAQPNELSRLGEFVDPWGTPYRMSVNGVTHVYSCGPNCIDEHGDGDDITSWK